MIESPSLNTTTTKPPKSTAFLLLFTILNTTWRAFVPPISGTFVGIYLDKLFNIVPVFTSMLIISGFVVSFVLIVLQIRRLK